MSVSNGQIIYPGYTSVNLAGTVSPQGAVKVNIRPGDEVANGTGHLTASSGAGGWRGSRQERRLLRPLESANRR